MTTLNTHTLDDAQFVELDDDTLLANFVEELLPECTYSEETLAEVLASMDPERPFAIRWADSGHGFGVTWDSSSKEITQAANQVMDELHRARKAARGNMDASLPPLTWFHQGGYDQPTGYQYWEMFGTSELAMFICDAIAQWLPGRTAQILDRRRALWS